MSLENLSTPKTVLNRDLRKKIIDMIVLAGQGHIPSAFSIIDILAYLYAQVLKFDSAHPDWSLRDYFILSKGHGCAALYVILEKYGFITQRDLDQEGTVEGILGGHPDATRVPGVEASTGSLGHGLGIALGIALGLQIRKQDNKVIVLLGDGECQEGTIWESALVAPHLQLGNLCCIVDRNLSADQILPLGDLKRKWASFGWQAYEMDGHSEEDMQKIFDQLDFQLSNQPKVIIAHTVKGKGVSFLESHGPWHYRAPNPEELQLICEDLGKEGV